ncbi:hypothetical protein D8M04_07490 [Oceanobacillus piezotolerans]|uniref:Uncharacterized protein n=1 Tax=Oceanobacillus piezotolerans TaxID=2448030 RepID=A0A498D8Z3_9BACI|nr:hypothetical protein [Oceanobacillus piezotolerans]RLL47026.1 hypothetical protein D8M04_07490 [Oceanobacillus piezotolerans]
MTETFPLQMECTMLFQSNPYMIETPEGISVRLGRKVEDILPVIDQLCNQGILQRLGDELTPLYRYQEPVIITNLDIQGEAERA